MAGRCYWRHLRLWALHRQKQKLSKTGAISCNARRRRADMAEPGGTVHGQGKERRPSRGTHHNSGRNFGIIGSGQFTGLNA